jgi:hypothetical protein
MSLSLSLANMRVGYALPAATGRSRPVLAMHKHTAWPPVGSAVVTIANGAEDS